MTLSDFTLFLSTRLPCLDVSICFPQPHRESFTDRTLSDRKYENYTENLRTLECIEDTEGRE